MLRMCATALIAWLCVPVFAQNPITADSPFQVHYAANLNLSDSIINITNTGATGGNVCVDVYAFSPDEQEISCCTCTVTPNALASMSVKNDILDNTLTSAVPTSLVIKLVSTAPRTGGLFCNSAGTANVSLATGLAAWMTTSHVSTTVTTSGHSKPVTTTTTTLQETPFTPSTLSAAEYATLTSDCAFIESDGSGSGICRACAIGGR